jgi:hypothetical protein
MMRAWLAGAALAVLASAAGAQGASVWRDASQSLPPKDLPGHAMNAQAVDIDGDGDRDLVIAMERGANRLLLNDGAGRFEEASHRLPRDARDSEETAVADFDRDGDLDIAVANEDDLLPELYLNDGSARFRDESRRLAIRVKANAVVAFDADRDGDADLLFGGDTVSHLMINDGRGRFRDDSVRRLPPIYMRTQDVAVGDIDVDGDLDLVFGNEDRNRVLVNNGSGVFTVRGDAIEPAGEPEETRDVDLVDLDADGDLDLVLANARIWNQNARAASRILLNDGQGRFVRQPVEAWPRERADQTVTVAAVDLTGDGLPELLSATTEDLSGRAPKGTLRVWRNLGGGRFAEMTGEVVPEGVNANMFDIAAADFNGDDKTDVFIAARGGRDVLLLSGPAPSAPVSP